MWYPGWYIFSNSRFEMCECVRGRCSNAPPSQASLRSQWYSSCSTQAMDTAQMVRRITTAPANVTSCYNVTCNHGMWIINGVSIKQSEEGTISMIGSIIAATSPGITCRGSLNISIRGALSRLVPEREDKKTNFDKYSNTIGYSLKCLPASHKDQSWIKLDSNF